MAIENLIENVDSQIIRIRTKSLDVSNSIAHGNFRSGISETEYSSWESKALSVMSNVMRLIYDYANNKMYLVS